MNVNKVQSTLSSLIKSMENTKSLFVVNPDRDFTRKRSIMFSDTIKCLLNMENHTLNSEIRYFFLSKKSTVPTSSAFIQQRKKLKENVFSYLFKSINNAFPSKKLFKGYHLLATDGSDINIPSLPGDTDTYIDSNTEGVGYYQYHLNALYDVCEKRYVDYIIQPRALANERTAFCAMVRNNVIDGKCIYTADRGYPSLNSIYNVIHAGQFFCFRLVELDGAGSLFKHTVVPDKEEFSIDIEFLVTRKYKKIYKSEPGKYKIVQKSKTFDGIPVEDKNSMVSLSFRLIKLKLDNGNHEYLITNLPESEFDIKGLKDLYHRRWDIETSFRTLKYNICLTSFHSKKRDFIKQEIEARIILYNITMIVVSCVKVEKTGLKYTYSVAISDAVVTVRLFLKGWLSGNNVNKALLKYLTPIRPDRTYQRKVRSKRVIAFNNRS